MSAMCDLIAACQTQVELNKHLAACVCTSTRSGCITAHAWGSARQACAPVHAQPVPLHTHGGRRDKRVHQYTLNLYHCTRMGAGAVTGALRSRVGASGLPRFPGDEVLRLGVVANNGRGRLLGLILKPGLLTNLDPETVGPQQVSHRLIVF